jgi:DNA replication protein DnaC
MADKGQNSDSTPPLTTAVDSAIDRIRKRAAAALAIEAEESARERARLVQQLAGKLGHRYTPERVSLDRFEVYHPAQADALACVHALADRLPELLAQGRGIVLYGLVGTGKDHLLASLLYAAVGQRVARVDWVAGQDLFGAFRDRISADAREEDLLRQYAAPDVLAISDPIPPIGDPSAWNVLQLYRLLDRRYRSLRSTWVSLNAVSIEDADAKLSAPVFDRLREGAEMIPCFWPSFRERNTRENLP